VLQRIQLVLDGLLDARMVMAEQVYPPGADGVDIALAVKIF